MIDGVPEVLPLDHLCLKEVKNALALQGKDFTLDYGALDKAVGQVAHRLLSMGLKAGDRVAAWLPKTRLACILPLCAARAGLIYVPINPQLKHAQVSHILADSGAKLLISMPQRLSTLGGGDVPAGVKLAAEAEIEEGGRDVLPPSTRDPAEVVEILYTSGSTGRPKGVVLTHINLMLGAHSVSSYLKLAAADRTLCLLPLSFDYGQNQLFSTWVAGGAAYPLDYLLPNDVVKAVAKNGITTLAAVPPLWTQLMRLDWPEEAIAPVRRMTNSGGAMPKPLIRQMRERFAEADLYLMYGLTEAFRSTYLDPELADTKPESMGKAIPYAEIFAIGPDSEEVGSGEPGELVHCGPLVAQGYWNDPERTALRFKPAPKASRYGGVAVWSGDTVVRDEEGYFAFVGRDDSMIKVLGNRISPTEIEEVAIESGLATEAVAFGVPDAEKGQSITLVIDVSIIQSNWEDKLTSYLKSKLPNFMLPDRIFGLAELPRNPNGKLDRTAIEAEYSQ